MTRCHVLHPDLKSNRRPGGSAAGPGEVLRDPAQALEEAVGLARAIDLEVVGADVVTLPKPHPGQLFGTGKTEELGAILRDEEAELVVVDGPLSPVQQRNLEKLWKVKILDRTGLILEIFGERAATREGVLQVELAHLNYAKTRLVRSWTHLERQRGGLGFVGGPGETQIEADRRALSERIKKIERRLETVVRTRELHRGARRKVPYPIVALVGYTNAGKSTLFNRLTDSHVMAEDMLFATLDPTMREIELPSGRKVILSDTVGFISDLPTQLVAAFRATLEEVLAADLILHVRDVSHPQSAAQKMDVEEVLGGLGVDAAARSLMLEVRNKVDLLEGEARLAMLNETGRRQDAVAVSALTGEGTATLLARIEARLGAGEERRHVFAPHGDGAALAWLHEHLTVERNVSTDDGALLDLRGDPEAFGRFFKRFPECTAIADDEDLPRVAE